MKNGMSLEDLRKNLESDATKRAVAQEKTIKELTAQLAVSTKCLQDNASDISALSERCFVLSCGAFCWCCTIKSKCRHNWNLVSFPPLL